MARVNFEVFKEPRAFIKILEIGIAVFAFSATGGFYSEYRVNTKLDMPAPPEACIDVKKPFYHILGKFEYPFEDGTIYTSNLTDAMVIAKCINSSKIVAQSVWPLKIGGKHKSDAEFFVFTGASTLVYCLIACIYYAVLENASEHMYSTDFGWCSWVVIDFLVGVLITVFWFAGSIALAAGLPGLKDDTSPYTYMKRSYICTHENLQCDITKEPNYATLKVSIILGFLNLFVWLGNLWFLFKETPWHNPRNDGNEREPVQ